MTANHGLQEGNIADEVNKLMPELDFGKGGTNYAAGLEKAAVSVNTSSASYKYNVFPSNGRSEQGGTFFQAALTKLKNLNVNFFICCWKELNLHWWN